MGKFSQEFTDLPLHDAILQTVALNWEQKTCSFELLVFSDPGKSAAPHVLEFFGVTHLVLPHTDAWGPSSSVNACSHEAGTFKVEMQSGDTIEVAARECSLAAV
jgi:hypothetical protein